MKLVLVRHGESIWNQQNLFTGWTDVELSRQGTCEAKGAGELLKESGCDFDICYTSYLKRAIRTLHLILEELDREWLPVVKTWKLNERHYGALQGENKAETAKRYGEEQVQIWRRTFDVQPPGLKEQDPRNPRLQTPYREVDKKELPLTESLEDTIRRVMPYFEKEICPKMRSGRRVLLVAHGNSIRALVKYFEHLSGEEVVKVNIPTGVPLVYEFDGGFHILHKYFLGNGRDPAAGV